MKFSKINCPECGERARGIIEQVMGCALLNDEDNEDGTVDYSGETDVWWSEQIPIHDGDGRVTLICPEGHEWQVEELDDSEPVVSDGDLVHSKDSDCTLDDTDTCTVCGVAHGDECPDCKQRGFHAKRCRLSDGTVRLGSKKT
jgi:hypothetical protein